MSSSLTSFLLLLLLAFFCILASSSENYADNFAHYSNKINKNNGEDNKYGLSSPEGGEVFTLKAHNLDETSLDNLLSFGYYCKTCAQLESIVHRKVNQWLQKDPSLGASLIRLHFHDCIVRVRLNHFVLSIIP